ncbi:hypothetical protein V6R21_24255 [Limibacter armeniacum]|uniref:hypothetical protein n=1 Tax=Limibacter armeniacum TaxID=466084 RepID=UPI002FE577FF
MKNKLFTIIILILSYSFGYSQCTETVGNTVYIKCDGTYDKSTVLSGGANIIVINEGVHATFNSWDTNPWNLELEVNGEITINSDVNIDDSRGKKLTIGSNGTMNVTGDLSISTTAEIYGKLYVGSPCSDCTSCTTGKFTLTNSGSSDLHAYPNSYIEVNNAEIGEGAILEGEFKSYCDFTIINSGGANLTLINGDLEIGGTLSIPDWAKYDDCGSCSTFINGDGSISAGAYDPDPELADWLSKNNYLAPCDRSYTVDNSAPSSGNYTIDTSMKGTLTIYDGQQVILDGTGGAISMKNIDMEGGSTIITKGDVSISNTFTATVEQGDTEDINIYFCETFTFPDNSGFKWYITLEKNSTQNVNIYGDFDCGDIKVQIDIQSGATGKLTVNGQEYTSSQSGKCTTILPVEMIFFSAKRQSSDVMLTWATASEVNNDYFEIQRSTDGKNFEIIGSVNGNGDSQARIDYEFIDTNAPKGTVYYRLKQVDYNGKFEYFNLFIKDSADKYLDITNLSGNPMSGQELKLQVYSATSQTVWFNLIGQNGTILHSEQRTVPTGVTLLTIGSDRIIPGIVLLQVIANDFQKTLKIIKQ